MDTSDSLVSSYGILWLTVIQSGQYGQNRLAMAEAHINFRVIAWKHLVGGGAHT